LNKLYVLRKNETSTHAKDVSVALIRVQSHLYW